MPILQTYFKTWDNTPYPTTDASFVTKMYSFGGPAGKKNIHKIYITATAPYATLEIYWRDELKGNWNQFGSVNITTSGGDTHEILPDNPMTLRGLNSIQFYFQLWSEGQSESNVLKIDDINIVYRTYRELSVEED